MLAGSLHLDPTQWGGYSHQNHTNGGLSMKLVRTVLALLVLLLSSVAIRPLDVVAAGPNSCASGDGCIARDSGGGGDFHGWNVNDSDYQNDWWANSTRMNNSASSVRNRNSYYISFCVYSSTGYGGSVSLHGKWSINGWSNALSGQDNTGTSSQFRIQNTC